MSWENFPINVWHQCNVKIHFGVVGVCWSNRQDGKSNKSHCWSWMRLRSMMVRTVDISLMLFIIHHPTICSQVPRPARTYVSIVSYRSNTPSSKNNLTSWLNNHWVSQHMTLESRSGGRIKFCFVFFSSRSQTINSRSDRISSLAFCQIRISLMPALLR